MKTEAQKRAQSKYQKKNIYQFSLCLHRNKDKDIINWIENQQNKQAAIRRLIRMEIDLQKTLSFDDLPFICEK